MSEETDSMGTALLTLAKFLPTARVSIGSTGMPITGPLLLLTFSQLLKGEGDRSRIPGAGLIDLADMFPFPSNEETGVSVGRRDPRLVSRLVRSVSPGGVPSRADANADLLGEFWRSIRAGTGPSTDPSITTVSSLRSTSETLSDGNKMASSLFRKVFTVNDLEVSVRKRDSSSTFNWPIVLSSATGTTSAKSSKTTETRIVNEKAA
mmetsp:Transcript_14213/g.23510  ORF Transcript_14213/g.23510 Transcript_14213/m.23510 type:complete len:207 (+) Transcript_14213:1308-1928(+)